MLQEKTKQRILYNAMRRKAIRKYKCRFPLYKEERHASIIMMITSFFAKMMAYETQVRLSRNGEGDY